MITPIDRIIQDKLVHLYYSIGQTETPTLRRYVKDIFSQISRSEKTSEYKDLLYRLTSYARDIPCGKGERDIAYYLIYEWYLVCPATCYRLICACVFMNSETESPYGGWRDLRGISYIVYQIGNDIKHPIIQYCIELLNYQLDLDWKTYCSESLDTVGSNVAKWIPRENSKWSWLFHELAYHWASVHTPYLCVNRYDANRKIYMNYRKICSELNRYTVENKLCNGPIRNGTIGIGRPSIYKYIRSLNQDDPILVQNMILNPQFPLKTQGFCGFHYCPGELVRMAINGSMEVDTLNLLWKHTIAQQCYVYSDFSYTLPIIDTGISMASQPNNMSLYNAIGIALAICECSRLGKRILLMGNNPAWITVSDNDGFVQNVKHILMCSSENTTNYLYKCIATLIWAFTQSFMLAEDTEQICVVLLSDMKMCDIKPGKSIHQCIRECFHENGIGYAYMPHMVYWGVSIDSDKLHMPCEPTDPRTTLISGDSSNGFEFLANMNLNSRRRMTPYTSLHHILSIPRYANLSSVLFSD
jgi:hypothetical protein